MTPTVSSAAALMLASLFQDGMVVPRDRPFSVWGRGAPGAAVEVCVGPHRVRGQVMPHGVWEVTIPAVPASRDVPFTVESAGIRVALKAVMAGDLWLCAGQSNMAMSLGQARSAGSEAALRGDSALRIFHAQRQLALEPGDSVPGAWQRTDPEPVPACPALPFHFGRLLRRELGDVPVGLLVSAMGDTPLEAWMSPEALAASGAGDAALARLDGLIRAHPEAPRRIHEWHLEWLQTMADYQSRLGVWMPLARSARAAGKPLPPKPERPSGLGDSQTPTVLYHGMLAPYRRLPLRGVLWYQGETDAIRGMASSYAALFRAFIQDLRRQWAQPDLPFLFVQLPRHDDIQSSLPPGQWAVLREAQASATALPRVTMIVGLDQGDSEQIHPARKEELARRLALGALAGAYGRTHVSFQGPECDRVERLGERLALHFRHAEAGLRGADGLPPRGFQVAGHDMEFVDARAELRGGTVVLYNDAVRDPMAVRYAWADDPDANLCNGAGLPVAPFRCRLGDPVFNAR